MALLLAGAFTVAVQARQNVRLAWDPSTNTTGVTYIIRYGTISGQPTLSLPVGSGTSYTITNLADGVTYYFVVVASSTLGGISEPSNEVRWTAPGVNTPPTISTISAQVAPENTPTAALGFAVDDTETPADSLLLSVRSSNAELVAGPGIVLAGSGRNRTIRVIPTAKRFGTATISLDVSDGALTSRRSFRVTFMPNNDPPTLDPIPDLNLRTNAGPTIVPLSGISPGPEEDEPLTVTATYNNPVLLTNLQVNYTNGRPTGTISFTTVKDVVGAAVVTVSVRDSDHSHTLSRSFVVAVSAVPAPRVIQVEAEAAVRTAPMIMERSSEASGGQYIYSTQWETGQAKFQVNIPEAGDYTMWCRVLSAHAGADSFYVSVNGGSEDVYDTAENTWTNRWQWTRVNGRAGGPALTINPRVFHLNRGAHRFVFRGREQGTFFDCLLLTKDRDFVPPSDARILAPGPGRLFLSRSGGTVKLSFLSVNGATYRVEYKDSWHQTAWTELTTVAGDGKVVTVSDTTGTRPQRFYRLRLADLPRLRIKRTGSVAALSFTSSRGANHVIEFKDSWHDSTWCELTTATGDGGVVTVTDATGGPQRFYRLRLP